MKEWTASRSTSNIKFVDFDNLSLSRHAPPICVGENWHYQCFLTWPTPRSVRPCPPWSAKMRVDAVLQ